MSATDYDLIVIGTGTAGSVVARRCRKAGWNVAIVDELPYGGTCALRGCDPKKVLVGAAEVIDWARRMNGHGVDGDLRIDWPALMAFKRTFTEPTPAKKEQSLASAGIATLHGTARFETDTTVRVGDRVIGARHVVIATGARPATLPIKGAELMTLSDAFLELDTLPKRIVFVGGGYVSFELAHVAARAGAEVLILHRGDRPLRGFDGDLVDRLVEAGSERGVRVELRAAVEEIERNAGGLAVRTRDGRTFAADLVVHGGGRVPNTDALALDAGRVDRAEDGGVVVNEFLQSVSNPAVYAAGDVAATGAPPLTPVSSHHAHVVADNLLRGNHRRTDLTEVPSVVFAIPPLAMVGLTEDAARAKGMRYRVRTEDASTWYSTRRTGESHAASKVLIEEGSDRILGVHLLGPNAAEVINVFGIAIRAGMTVEETKETTFAYPTGASDVSYVI